MNPQKETRKQIQHSRYRINKSMSLDLKESEIDEPFDVPDDIKGKTALLRLFAQPYTLFPLILTSYIFVTSSVFIFWHQQLSLGSFLYSTDDDAFFNLTVGVAAFILLIVLYSFWTFVVPYVTAEELLYNKGYVCDLLRMFGLFSLLRILSLLRLLSLISLLRLFSLLRMFGLLRLFSLISLLSLLRMFSLVGALLRLYLKLNGLCGLSCTSFLCFCFVYGWGPYYCGFCQLVLIDVEGESIEQKYNRVDYFEPFFLLFSGHIKRHWKRILLGITLLMIGFSCSVFLAVIDHSCVPDLELGVEPYFNETVEMAKINAVIRQTMDFASSQQQKLPFRRSIRGQHAKSVGCVHAEFNINEDIPDIYAKGLFGEKGKSYKSWIRYSTSSQDITNDNEWGARGMAIKIFDIEKGKSLSVDAEKDTQDFVLLSAGKFFMNDNDQYVDILGAFPNNIGRWLYRNLFNIETWRTLYAVIDIFTHSSYMENPLYWKYSSATPYLLGEGVAVKYIAEPCVNVEYKANRSDPDFLRKAMHDTLTKEDICFDFFIQIQEDSCEQPVYNNRIEWESTLIKVATINIPKQEFINEEYIEYCENLSYNPWHTRDAHKPMGAMNRARKFAYSKASAFRLQQNKQSDFDYHNLPPFSEVSQAPAFTWLRSYENRTKIAGGDTDNYQYAAYRLPFVDNCRQLSLPNHAKKLEKRGRFTSLKAIRIMGSGLAGGNNFLQEVIGVDGYNRIKHPSDYINVLNTPTMRSNMPKFAFDNLWLLDSVFAYQFIRGVNPLQIARIFNDKPIPEAFDLTDERIEYINTVVLETSIYNFEMLYQKERLFYVDYQILDGIPRCDNERVYGYKEKCYLYQALGMLYLDEKGILLPLLIQLEQTDELDKMYFPPQGKNESSTEYITWTFAKMHLMQSDTQIHETVTHLALTHLALEPAIIATFRIFSKDHVLFKLLLPHMRQTLAINELGRRTLLNMGGYFDVIMAVGLEGTMKLMEKAWLGYNFTARAFPRELASRGFTRVKNIGGSDDYLPGYLYRDYGFKIWDAVYNYVNDVIYNHIPSDEALQNDIFIQRWAWEIADPDHGRLNGFPSSFSSREVLVDACANLIFTASAQHSSVNFGQFDFYGFIPNRPMALEHPMPEDPSTINWQYIVEALPKLDRSISILTITNLLSTTPAQVLKVEQDDDVKLGSFIKELLDISEPYWQPQFKEEWKKFDAELREHSEFMHNHNRINGYHYRYLFYEEIAMSVSV